MTSKIYTFYDKLSIPRNASDEEIIDAYNKLFEKYNPDKFDGEKKQQAEKILASITVAYENLSNPITRTAHDRWIDQQDRNSLSEISKSLENAIGNVGNEIKNAASNVDLDAIGNEIKHISENAKNKISDIGDGLKNFAKNTGDKIDFDDISENAEKKFSDIGDDLKGFTKNTGDKIKSIKEKIYPFLKVSAYIAIPVFLLVIGFNTIKPNFNFNLNEIIQGQPESILEKLTMIGISTDSDFKQFIDQGGITKNPNWHGFYVEKINTAYHTNGKLAEVGLDINSKATWLSNIKIWNRGESPSPKEIREVLSKVCNVHDSDWEIKTDGIVSGWVETDSILCIYDYILNNRIGFSIKIKAKK